MNLSEEQEEVAAQVMRGINTLITGSAGTGKSTLLKELTKRFKGDLPVCASTGIAAVNVGGMTIHSWAGLGMGEDTAAEIAGRLMVNKNPAYKRIMKAKRVAVDEVSMIHGQLFDKIDDVFRIVRECDLPFGGVQIITFGDFLQLPPVSKGIETAFAFEAKAWTQGRVKTAMLTKVFRQADAAFSGALNQVRVANLTPEVLALLRSRYRAHDPHPEIEPVTVYTHNADVDAMNHRRLREVKGEEKKWDAFDRGENPYLTTIQKNCLAPAELILRVGAQVMLLWNLSPHEGLANGSIGVIKKFSNAGLPVVKFANGLEEEIKQQTWAIESGGQVLASRNQIPLRLAYAITVHKSQGMTLDKIRVHLDRAFEFGQAYVALSRARTLEGLFIESTKQGCIKAHPHAVAFYEGRV